MDIKNSKKIYLGCDLGDGEFITDITALNANMISGGVHIVFTDMTMPDLNDSGKAMPTAYGYNENNEVVFSSTICECPEEVKNVHVNFKRRPTDLMPALNEERYNCILEMLAEGWPDKGICHELYSPAMDEFGDSVITFLNAVFSDEKYKNRVRSESSGSDEIVFCVGHPTNWNELDIAIYKQIIARSILGEGAYVGLRTKLVVAAESRAAFLYVRDRAGSGVLPKGTCALLVDIGSSTIDLTAITSDSRNHIYNSGSNYLGARSIDYLIRDWYLERLKKNPDIWAVYQEYIELNPTAEKALLLCCRLAKEKVFSIGAGSAQIYFAGFSPIKITKADVLSLVETKPIANVLKLYSNLPSNVIEAMSDKSWKTLFEEFLKEKKAEMDAKGIKLGRIILTGSASKMSFIRESVLSVFNELDESLLLDDMDPSRSISKGLAMVGSTDEKYEIFLKDIDNLIKKDLPEIIRNKVPDLAETLGEVISEKVIHDIVFRMQMWKQGDYKTLDDMTKAIENDCNEANLKIALENNEKYKDAVTDWTVNGLGEAIALQLNNICNKYGVSNIKLDSLNIMKKNKINVSGVNIDPSEEITKALVNILSIVAGVVAGAVFPTIVTIILTIIWIVFDVFLIIPGGPVILLAVAASVGIVALTKHELGRLKAKIVQAMKTFNFPIASRNLLLRDNSVIKKIAEADLPGQIKKSITNEESVESIVASLSQTFRKQIIAKAEDIKYAIDAK